MQPKVFVSHASEDKARFVIPFATALRGKGIDAWVDQWEMLPGDSLVAKIFDEGIKNASAVIIVISTASLLKPWVRQELDASVVARISRGMTIIPIVLDGAEVPESLRSTVWEPVSDPNDFRTCLDRVVNSILGLSTKPPLGDPRAHLESTPKLSIDDINAVDAEVLGVLYQDFLADKRNYVYPKLISQKLESLGISSSLVEESLEILEHKGFLAVFKTLAGPPFQSRIASPGISKMLGGDEADLIKKVGMAIVDKAAMSSNAIAVEASVPAPLARHAIDILKHLGHLNYMQPLSGDMRVHSVSPMLRRVLQDR